MSSDESYHAMRPLITMLAALVVGGCQPDPALELPPSAQVCDALADGEIALDDAEDGPQVDVHLVAKGRTWGDAGHWGDVACGEVFAAVGLRWTVPTAGLWNLFAEVEHAAAGRAQGLRFPLLMVWTDGRTCGCLTDERGSSDQHLDLRADDTVSVLVGLESTANRTASLEEEFSVPYRLRLVPEAAP